MARLKPEERRAQLIALGVELVGASSFDAVSVDEVAAAAGISRSLLFHYFPTRADFLVAVAEAAAEELFEATAPDPSVPPDEQLRAGLSTFLDYIEARREAYLSLVRGAAGGEAGLQAVFDRTRDRITERVIDGMSELLPADTLRDPRLRMAVRGWVAFNEEVAQVWLSGEPIGRDELLDLMANSLAALAFAAGIDADGVAAAVSA